MVDISFWTIGEISMKRDSYGLVPYQLWSLGQCAWIDEMNSSFSMFHSAAAYEARADTLVWKPEPEYFFKATTGFFLLIFLGQLPFHFLF